MKKRKIAVALLSFSAWLLSVPAPHAQPPLAAVPLSDSHVLRIRLWEGTAASKELIAVDGRQSRDLGAKLRQAAREEKLKPLEGRHEFRLEFSNLAFELARGQKIIVNSEVFLVPQGFGSQGRAAIAVTVTNGEGWVEISASWVKEETVIKIAAPPTLGDLHYPPPPYRELRTKRGELARLVGEHEASNYHFVK